MDNYSVLMTVYHKEKAEHFAASIQSMLDQSVRTDDFVIVCDGELTKELDQTLEAFVDANPGLFQIVRLPENVGVGLAAKEGLLHCKNELVAKMDSDDISVTWRCELQLQKFAENTELTVVGGFIEEFDACTGEPFAVRSVPLSNEGIRQYAKRRSPFNNVTVMYKKSAVLAVGSYRKLSRGEDYDVFLRLLIAGYYAENLPDTLVKVRVDSDAIRRRSSVSALKGNAGIWWYSFRMGYSGFFDLVICLTAELVLFICPHRVKQVIYNCFLREKVGYRAVPDAADRR